jgi:hypothetical protein
MSGCHCDSPKQFRITGEVDPKSGYSLGPGQKEARVRCRNCGGKIGWIGSAILTELFQIDPSDIQTGRCLEPDERIHIEVDLI